MIRQLRLVTAILDELDRQAVEDGNEGCFISQAQLNVVIEAADLVVAAFGDEEG